MPLYEYECPRCDQTVEMLVKSPQDCPACPECGSTRMTRLISAPSAPAVRGGQDALPVAGGGESCGMPRCCGGICQ